MSFKEYEKAIQDYQLCYQHNPKQLEAYIEEAEVTYQAEGLEPALHKYNTLLVNYHKIWPSSQYSSINYVKYRKSLLLIQEKDYQAAIALLVQITNA
jgi:tetratricopeptide (TPR) repeat protein